MNSFARREFLKQTTTAILGFPFALSLAEGAEPAKAEPAAARAKGPAAPPPTADELFAAAKERMKAECKPGVLILVPANPQKAAKLANDLSLLLGGKEPACAVAPAVRMHGPQAVGGGNAEARPLFCQAVFVCLPEAAAQKAFPKLHLQTGVVLLDQNGKYADELKGSDTLFAEQFTSEFTTLLHGKRGERLAANIEAQRKAMGREAAERLDASVRALEAEQFLIRQQAAVVLAGLAPRATAQLAAELRKQPPLETRRRLEYYFDELFSAASEESPSVRLPFGAQWNAQAFDSCPACGLSRTPQQARLFLRFLVQDKK